MITRKFIVYIRLSTVLLILVAFLSGCASTLIPTNSVSTTKSSLDGKVQMVTDIDGLSSCYTSQGYYNVEVTSSGLAKIFFTDFENKKRIVLCNRPECTHSDSTCNGVIDRWASVFHTGGKLYLYYPDNNIGEIAEDKLARIETLNLDGTDRRLVYQFDANEAISYGIAADNSNLYFTRQHTVEKKQVITQSFELVKLNLDTCILTILSKDRLEVDTPVGAQGSKLLIKKISQINNMQVQHEVTCYDLLTNEEKSLAKWTNSNIASAVFGDSLFLLNSQNKELSIISPEKGTQVVSVSGLEEQAFNSVSLTGKWGNYLYANIASSNTNICIDCQTGEATPLTLSYHWVINNEPYDYYYSILAQVDHQLLVICGGEKVEFTALYADGTPIKQEGYEITYALIPQEDFNQNDLSHIFIIDNIDKVLS